MARWPLAEGDARLQQGADGEVRPEAARLGRRRGLDLSSVRSQRPSAHGVSRLSRRVRRYSLRGDPRRVPPLLSAHDAPAGGDAIGRRLRRRGSAGSKRQREEMMANKLKDKVVLVTGAGGGIGREMALLAAREGASVVVNDLGGAVDGEGSGSATPAQKVCDEIKAAGGKAVPNADSVTDPAGAERMIKTAVETFGRIDGVINNAGILRDRNIHRMSHMDWKMVIDVHLNGAFNVSRAAANYFKEQKSGAFVHFTSTSGLVGNFGQANYSAAKMGIIGLSRSIALDMAAFNVRSNCISPFAWTRLIGTIH